MASDAARQLTLPFHGREAFHSDSALFCFPQLNKSAKFTGKKSLSHCSKMVAGSILRRRGLVRGFSPTLCPPSADQPAPPAVRRKLKRVAVSENESEGAGLSCHLRHLSATSFQKAERCSHTGAKLLRLTVTCDLDLLCRSTLLFPDSN